MQIIAELERTPRGIYTGCVGRARARAQRLDQRGHPHLVVDRGAAAAEYGTGSGIVWDSQAGAELAECRTKTLVLGGAPPAFSLIETLAWVPGEGLLLLERHLRRLADSAAYFGFARDPDAVRARLAAATAGLRVPQRVRLLLDERGGVQVAVTPLRMRTVDLGDRPPAGPPRAACRARARAGAPRRSLPVPQDDRREVYERALAGRPGCDEVILWNEEGEVTEATIANLVVRDARVSGRRRSRADCSGGPSAPSCSSAGPSANGASRSKSCGRRAGCG